MKVRRLLPSAVLAIAASSRALAVSPPIAPRAAVIPLTRTTTPAEAGSRIAARLRPSGADAGCTGLCYSVELPQISRVQGFAFYRTAVDISNNTSTPGVVARFQYTYNCTVTCPKGPFLRTPEGTITLRAFDNFHSDDFVDYMRSLGMLAPNAENGSYGTLLVTFDNLPSRIGWEGTVTARNYNRLVESNPSLGTIAYAYPASLFFESAHQSLVATIHDTQPAPTLQGSLRTNLGIRNTDIHGGDPQFVGTNRSVSVQVTFYDVTPGSPTNGKLVGQALTFTDLRPGEVRQFTNVFQLAQIPSAVTDVLAFVDILPIGGTNPNQLTIEGYVNVVDNVTQDGSFFEMKCADLAIPTTCGQ